MLISVIVPIYKVEKYLPQCLDSIINQTYKELEIILVPQPGGDECETICREYEKIDSRIIVCTQKMCDLSHARNVGIDCANGGYIAFVDSDDILDCHFIEYLFCLAQKHDADIVQCSSYAFLDEKVISNKIDYEFEKEYSGKGMCYVLANNMYGSDSGVIQTKLYDIKLFQNIRFPEGRVNEDGATNYKLYWNARKVVVTGHKLYYYRSQRKGSIIHTRSDRLYRDAIISSIERQQFFANTHEKALYEYATYMLYNDIIRAQCLINNDPIYCHKLNALKKDLLYEIKDASYLGLKKKNLARLGWVSPKMWIRIWDGRNRWRHFVEWKIKGEKK